MGRKIFSWFKGNTKKIANTVKNANDLVDDAANGDKPSEGEGNLATGKDAA